MTWFLVTLMDDSDWDRHGAVPETNHMRLEYSLLADYLFMGEIFMLTVMG